MIAEHSNVVYAFGSFLLELREHRLVCGDRSIPLTGKAFCTLCTLVELHGKLVSKQELVNSVWPGTTVQENNLDRNISILRKAPRPGNGQSFIENLAPCGYRFIAAVSETTADPPCLRAPQREPSTRQEIRFCLTGDKVRLAYSIVGSGHPW